MAALESHGWTYERMVAELPPESRYELADGVLLSMSPAPDIRHYRSSKHIERLLFKAIEDQSLGEVFHAPVDVRLAPDQVVQPDVFVVLNGGAAQVTAQVVDGAPDLVAEIISPTSYRRDNVEKRALYARYGVKEYWVIDPANQVIEVNTLVGDTYALHAMANPEEGEPKTVTSALLPQLSVSLVEVFER